MSTSIWMGGRTGLRHRDEPPERRLNNWQARLKANELLKASGRAPIKPELNYLQFAEALRARLGGYEPFATRAEAVAYIRDVARTGATSPRRSAKAAI